MTTKTEVVSKNSPNPANNQESQDLIDYTYVSSKARIACYDDLLSDPRITEINPAPTKEFLTTLADTIYQQAHQWESSIPYAVIADVSENFIHAQFTEMVVSIFNHGNTIRFSDQGPGIPFKDRAQNPGFSTATEPMKEFIHGVGSGLPRVKEYLACNNGTITIEDNLGSGAVVTISFDEEFEDDFESFEDNEHEYSFNAITQDQTQDNLLEFQQNPEYMPYTTAANAVPQIPTQPYPYTQGNYITQGYQQGVPQGYPQVQQGYPTAYPQTVVYQPASILPGAPQNSVLYPPQNNGYQQQNQPQTIQNIISNLSERERETLRCFRPGKYLRNIDIYNISQGRLSKSTISNCFEKLEKLGLLTQNNKSSRSLTELGVMVVHQLR